MYQKYSIGTMAKLLGISAEAIRYYESRNIIQPVRDPETGYRYYNTWDFHMLLRARHYQNYGFSLEEVADLFCSRELSGIQAQMGMQEAGIQREIVRQINLLKRIRQRERIDRRRQHAHVVCAGALHFAAAVLNAAPEVAAADDNADLAAFLIALFDYVTYRPDHIKIQAEMLIPCKRFAADLDQHALIFRCSHIPHSLLLIPAFYSTLLPPVLQRVFKIFQGNLQLLLCRIQKFQMTA